ncbi:MAG TPA: DinB family protein, partial [Variovorax sp.]|nr:DinB family protein [Variovorax sp.]
MSPAGTSSSIDSPDMRRAGRELLSLALIDARNHTLHLLSLYEQALGSETLAVPRVAGIDPPVWLAGHIGWFAEWWIGRNTQRAFGEECPVRPTRLAAIEPDADDWWNPAQRAPADRDAPGLPDLAQTKAYLLDTLESTLELLEHAAETDAGLYFYRLALFHEDLRGEQLLVMAQTLGLPLKVELPPAAVTRPPLSLPATSWTLGLPQGGFAFAQEG